MADRIANTAAFYSGRSTSASRRSPSRTGSVATSDFELANF